MCANLINESVKLLNIRVTLTVITKIIKDDEVCEPMTNVLQAIINLVKTKTTKLEEIDAGKNRANNMGEALEIYVKNLFANSFSQDANSRDETFSKVFSYCGNKNNPPDFIIEGGDAIEVKKIESQRADLALNSSPPKSKLHRNDSRITNCCRSCEKWTIKDIIYVVGHVSKKELLSLSFVYGEDYAASPEIYEKIASTIRSGVISIDDVEFEETNELARVNRVDPLGITYLRVRGMWGIKNPLNVFKSIYSPVNGEFNFMCVINFDKYNSLPVDDRNAIEKLSKESTSLSIKEVKIKVPDNPAQLKNAKLITFHI